MNYLEYVAKCLAISKIGLKFSTDPYAIENYQMLEKLSREMMTQLNEGDKFINYDRDFYPTPSSSVRVLIFDELDRILLVKESRDFKYSIPGGWCDVFDTISETAVKETLEESGLEVEVIRLLAIFQRERYKNYTTALSEQVHYILARVVGGKFDPCHEVLEVGYYHLEEIKELDFSNSMTDTELNIAINVAKNNLDTFID